MFKKMFAFTVILGILLSACDSQKPELLSVGDQQGQSASGPELLNDGQGPAVALSPQGTAAPGDDTSIDDSGNIIPSAPGSSDSGTVAGSQSDPYSGTAPDGQPALDESDAAMKWIDYTDPAFGFSFTYPDLYTVLKETKAFSEIAPNLVGRTRLLEPVLVDSAFAEMELPKFSIEIYSNVPSLALDKWITANAAGGNLKSVKVDGVACSQLTLNIEIAPNQFIFCAKGDKIFKFTPLGPQSEKILASFKFSRP